MTFIEQIQKEAREKLAKTSEYINDTLWYVNPQDLDSLISQVVQSTINESIQRLYDEYGELDGVFAVLKDITSTTKEG